MKLNSANFNKVCTSTSMIAAVYVCDSKLLKNLFKINNSYDLEHRSKLHAAIITRIANHNLLIYCNA